MTCPFCDSEDVELVSPWGGQIITRQMRCRTCHTYFEAIREEFDGVPENGAVVPENGTGVPENGAGVPEHGALEPDPRRKSEANHSWTTSSADGR